MIRNRTAYSGEKGKRTDNEARQDGCEDGLTGCASHRGRSTAYG